MTSSSSNKITIQEYILFSLSLPCIVIGFTLYDYRLGLIILGILCMVLFVLSVIGGRILESRDKDD